MKKVALILCFCALLTSCTIENQDDNMPEETTITSNVQPVVATVSNIDFPFYKIKPTPKKITSKLSDEEISRLSTQKCGYGQGVRLDQQNRPFCALDFNSQFSNLDAVAITEKQKEICLTFDQGYENGYTSKILDTLKEKDVKAIFFVLDDYAKRNPELVQRMIDEGHTIGNHSVHHYSMPTLDINTCRKEITNEHDYIKEKFDYDMYLFRPPMGEFSEKSIAITQSCGYKTVMWSYAYADWNPDRQMAPCKALAKITDAIHPGAIYLLHSVSKTNCEILGDFIDNVKAQGYEFSATL